MANNKPSHADRRPERRGSTALAPSPHSAFSSEVRLSWQLLDPSRHPVPAGCSRCAKLTHGTCVLKSSKHFRWINTIKIMYAQHTDNKHIFIPSDSEEYQHLIQTIYNPFQVHTLNINT